MEKENNKIKFTIIWSSCVCFLLLLVGLGILSDKGTSALSSDTPAKACYCFDNDEGKTVCELFDVDEAAGKIPVELSKCNGTNLPSDTTYVCFEDKADGYHWAQYGKYKDNSSFEYRPDLSYENCDPVEACFEDSEGAYIWLFKSEENMMNYKLHEEYTDYDSCIANGNKTDVPDDNEFVCFDGPADGLYWAQYGKYKDTPGYNYRSDLSHEDCDILKYVEVTVNLDANGGTISGTSGDTIYVKTCYASVTATNSNPSCYVDGEVYAEREGYTFNGWGASCSNITAYTFKVKNKDAAEDSDDNVYDVKACWTKNSSTSQTPTDPELPSGGGSTSTDPSTPADPETPSEPTEPSGSSSSSSSNVTENPKTGEITIFIVWVVAVMAIVYSVWYFKKVKEN